MREERTHGWMGRRQLLAVSAAALLAGCARAPNGRSGAGGSGTTPAAAAASTASSTASGSTTTSGLRATAPAAVIRARPQVPVLCFHQIRDWRPQDPPSAREIITPPQRLAEQLASLADAGYTTITPDQLLSYLEFGTPLGARRMLLTFDDASVGQYTNALPLLLRHHFTATYFVMTVVLDKPGWLSRAQVRDLHRRGMTIGSHTYDHHPVTGYRADDWRTQLVRPGQELSALIGGPVRHFAYPYGVWDRAALPHVRAAGYQAAFQLAGQQDPQQPLLTIRRMIASSGWDGASLLRQIRSNF